MDQPKESFVPSGDRPAVEARAAHPAVEQPARLLNQILGKVDQLEDKLTKDVTLNTGVDHKVRDIDCYNCQHGITSPTKDFCKDCSEKTSESSLLAPDMTTQHTLAEIIQRLAGLLTKEL